jgi:hypothetical protein
VVVGSALLLISRNDRLLDPKHRNNDRCPDYHGYADEPPRVPDSRNPLSLIVRPNLISGRQSNLRCRVRTSTRFVIGSEWRGGRIRRVHLPVSLIDGSAKLIGRFYGLFRINLGAMKRGRAGRLVA